MIMLIQSKRQTTPTTRVNVVAVAADVATDENVMVEKNMETKVMTVTKGTGDADFKVVQEVVEDTVPTILGPGHSGAGRWMMTGNKGPALGGEENIGRKEIVKATERRPQKNRSNVMLRIQGWPSAV